MEKIVTQNDLLRYAYHETTENENAEIEQAIESDWNLNEKYQSLLRAQSFLGKPKYQPSQTCIDAILQYSRNHRHAESHC